MIKSSFTNINKKVANTKKKDTKKDEKKSLIASYSRGTHEDLKQIKSLKLYKQTVYESKATSNGMISERNH